MDKPKIVIICGTGSSLSSDYIKRLIAAGKDVFDIEVMDANDTFFSRKADVAIWDDLQSMDFTSLEERAARHQSWFSDNMPKDPEERQRWKDEMFFLRYGSYGKRGLFPTVPKIKLPIDVPADQRKGPKGPRGKWGKLK